MLIVFIVIIIAFVFINGFVNQWIKLIIDATVYLLNQAYAMFSDPSAVNPFTLFTLCAIILSALILRNYLKIKAPVIIGVVATILVMFYSANFIAPIFH